MGIGGEIVMPFRKCVTPTGSVLRHVNCSIPGVSGRGFGRCVGAINGLTKVSRVVGVAECSNGRGLIVRGEGCSFLSDRINEESVMAGLLDEGMPVALIRGLATRSSVEALVGCRSTGASSLVSTLGGFWGCRRWVFRGGGAI